MFARSLHPARFAAPATLFLLLMAVYGDALLRTPMPVISGASHDAHRYFSVSRAFGFGEIARGNLPLWNPHVFLGVPYLGGVQSALFYPVNLIYLLLPLPLALNIDALFHIWLLGVGFYLWVREHGISRGPAIFSGAVSMLAAPYFLHAWSGHLTMFAGFAWAPYFFLAIDRILHRPNLRDTALGIGAVSMMLLAGYPQAAYNCALIAGIYLLFQLPSFRAQPVAKAAALVAIALAPGLVAAAQLAPAAAFAAESVRAGGVDRTDSFEYSLLPHHLIRTVAPGFFGGTTDTAYWGGGYQLESGAFIGCVTLVLVFFGIAARRWASVPALAVIVVSGLLALGPHTPVAPLFHDWMPGFDRFRAPGRYWMFVAWFGALLAGIGLHQIAGGTTGKRAMPFIAGTTAFCAWAGYVGIRVITRSTANDSWWAQFVDSVSRLNGDDAIALNDALEVAARTAPSAILTSAIVLSVLAFIFAVPMRVRWRTFAIGCLGCLELVWFARSHAPTFNALLLEPSAIVAYETSRERGTRVLNLANNNEAMRAGAYDISGYEPGMLGRTDRFLSHPNAGLFTRGADGGLEGNAVAALLRCAAVVDPNENQVYAAADVMPRFAFISNYEVISDPDALLQRLYDPAFDAPTTVLVEDAPSFPAADRDAPAEIAVLEQSTDEAELEIAAPVDGFLLCADAYSTGWHVEALEGSAQDAYSVVPAYHALRAIPLRAGFHRLRMYYEPNSFKPALWVSIVSVAVLNAVLLGLIFVRLPRS